MYLYIFSICKKYYFSFYFFQGHKMYKVLTSFWSKPVTSNHNNNNVKSQLSTDTITDEDDWVLVGKIHTTNDNDNHNNSSLMTNSWLASPPLIRNDQSLSINRSSSPNTHHFNPIENLLIEHASMKNNRF